MNGFISILKPPGMTSAAVAACMKRLSGEKHIGHAGTLDPEAAGVLPLMLGRATRLFDDLVDKEKSYVAEVAFGQATDTMDAQGRVTETGDNYPDLEKVRAAAEKLTGDIEQTPSMYSAIKVAGKPLYERARKGETLEVPARTVHIERLQVTEERPNHGFLLHIDCGGGTYVRSICDDMGRLTGCPAHMRFLLRTRSGFFTLENSLTLEEAAALSEEGKLGENLLPMDAPLMHLPEVRLPLSMSKPALNGARLPLPEGREDLEEGARVRTYLGDTFLGLSRVNGRELVWKVLILPGTPA